MRLYFCLSSIAKIQLNFILYFICIYEKKV
jgi:hypothetical protein